MTFIKSPRLPIILITCTSSPTSWCKTYLMVLPHYHCTAKPLPSNKSSNVFARVCQSIRSYLLEEIYQRVSILTQEIMALSSKTFLRYRTTSSMNLKSYVLVSML
ncbi:hypothetical protein MJO28_004606 [Puccinia striiformis f. sp. tritici]|uniref:Uncharacterized protein n=1 Tax=Puccinia striiformis f. sp. tritici TaxID=168172 RepID=A0ACC0EQA6_9BASI|nr:hypothetical protein MJO28_004606 [Puccinia striiformis f. sp. tritici]